MNIVLFAGGVGSRLWPLSRKNAPKQFGKIIGNKTMLQIAVGKLFPLYDWNNLYISTGTHYAEHVIAQLPELSQDHILIEPEMRDVGPAVGLVTALFMHKAPDEPIALLWGSDHLVRDEEAFRTVLSAAEKLIKEDGKRIVFLGQKPRFANQNVGYIEYGEEMGKRSGYSVRRFTGFAYRPHLSLAEKWVKDNRHAWNLGYFVTTPRFLWKLFQEFAPELFVKLSEIYDTIGTPRYQKTLARIYPTIEKISFDNAVLEKMNPKYGLVISADLKWSDIGAWEALKEALVGDGDETATRGNVLVEGSKDSLVFNFTKQLVVGIDMSDLVVVNTADVVLICPKDSVPKIKKLVENLRGTAHEHLA
jgi:mannose-1-phosphate guanylyltransferase